MTCRKHSGPCNPKPYTKGRAIMCKIDGCPYKQHSSTVLNIPLCQQHQEMYINWKTLGDEIFDTCERKYTRKGFPLTGAWLGDLLENYPEDTNLESAQ